MPVHNIRLEQRLPNMNFSISRYSYKVQLSSTCSEKYDGRLKNPGIVPILLLLRNFTAPIEKLEERVFEI